MQSQSLYLTPVLPSTQSSSHSGSSHCSWPSMRISCCALKTHIQETTALPGASLCTPMLCVLCLQPILHRKHQQAQDACVPRLASFWRTRCKVSPDSQLCHFCSQGPAQPQSLCAPLSAKLSTRPDPSRCPRVSSVALQLTISSRPGHMTLSLLSGSSLRAGTKSTLQEQPGWLREQILAQWPSAEWQGSGSWLAMFYHGSGCLS